MSSPGPVPPPKKQKMSPELRARRLPQYDLNGYCGYFRRVRKWEIANPVPGVIIQRVTRTFNVQYLTPTSASSLSNYVTDPNSSVNENDKEYWELWTVSQSGNVYSVSDTGEDTFGLCSLIPWNGKGKLNWNTHIKRTTKGSFLMSGTANFYATSTPSSFASNHGFTKNGPKSAGGLYSSATQPTNMPVPDSGPVAYTAAVTWDSNSTRKSTSDVKTRLKNP